MAILGYVGFKNYREAQALNAGDALLDSETVEQLESAVASYGSTASGAALKLRLAKAYYDAGSFKSALEAYRELEGKAPEGFEEIPALGIAASLEGDEQYEEALKAYETFASEHPASPYAIEALVGGARAMALGGDKEGALKRLAALKEEKKDDEAAVQAIEKTEDVVKRWEKRSLFDMVGEVEKAVEEAEKVEEPEVQEAAPVEEPAEQAPESEQTAPAE